MVSTRIFSPNEVGGGENCRRICYIPVLEGQREEMASWAKGAAERFGIHIVTLQGVDWNNDLTPWAAEPIFRKGKSFGGGAERFLQELKNDVFPKVEKALGLSLPERSMAGVSLGGLFALWALGSSEGLFDSVASVSGSFWYKGFTSWLSEASIEPESRAYLSLGDKEGGSSNPSLTGIEEKTLEVKTLLEEKGAESLFEWNEGSHFGPVIPRLEKALSWLTREIIPAASNDIPAIMEIIDAARGIMRRCGNPFQWPEGYPSSAMIQRDIDLGGGFVIRDGGKAVGYFAFLEGPEPTYSEIEGGGWLAGDAPYQVIHRIASYPHAHGIFQSVMRFCQRRDRHLRIDTHEDNSIMRGCLLKSGFSYRGIIHLSSGAPRLAYQRIL